MTDKNETELMEATAAAIKEPRPKTELELAKEKIGPLKEVLEKEAEKNNWDIGVSDDFQEALDPPKVRFYRRATVSDAVRAEQLAIAHYGEGKADYKPTGQQTMIAKLCTVCLFDGKPWNIPQVEKLGEPFFTNIVVRFSDYLGS
jgi:hypothetical protein